jgi:branched-chain amino acid transport system permease protein
MTSQRLLLGAALAALALFAPFLVYPVFLMKVLCFALFASAFNLLIGFTGLLSFGHCAFFGVAGYVVGHLVKEVGLTVELALLAGVAASTALGYAFGALAIRRQGIYFAMITLGLSQLVYFVCLQTPATGRDDGLQAIPRGTLFGLVDLSDDRVMYLVVLAFVAGGLALIFRVVHSPFGQVLKGIRENEPRTVSLGYEVDRFKVLAFTLSAGLSGLAGGLKALVLGFASLVDVHWSTSGEVVLMTLLGGIGTLTGPTVGAAVILTLQNWLSDKVGLYVQVVIGAVFVACVLAFRRGIVGELQALATAQGGWQALIRRVVGRRPLRTAPAE